jgi:hypothetical protein
MSARRFTAEEAEALEYAGHGAFVAEAKRAGLIDTGLLPQLSTQDIRDWPAEAVVKAQEIGLLDATMSGTFQRDLSWAAERFKAGEADAVATALRDGELVDVAEGQPREWHALLAANAPPGSWTKDQYERASEDRDVDAITKAVESDALRWADQFEWRTMPGEDQILTEAELKPLSPEEVVALQEEGRLDWLLGIGGHAPATEAPTRADDPLFAQHADQIASGAAAPEYNAAGQLVGIRTSPDAIGAYRRLGGATSDPNLSGWKQRHAEQSKPSLKKWQPPAEGSQWSEADLAAAGADKRWNAAIVEAGDRGDLDRLQGIE